MRWEVKQGDYGKPWTFQLEDEDGIPDLRGRDVWLAMSNVQGSAGNLVRQLPELPPSPDGIDAEHGWASVVWVPPELDVIGVFRAEVRVDPGTPQQLTWPNDDYDHVVVKSPA